MTTKRVVVLAVLDRVLFGTPDVRSTAKTVTKGPIVTQDSHHDTGPLLREIAPLLPEFNPPTYHEIDNHGNPNFGSGPTAISSPDPVLQRPENSPTMQTPNPGPGIRRPRLWGFVLLQLHAGRQRRRAGHDPVRASSSTRSMPSTARRAHCSWDRWLEIPSGPALAEAVSLTTGATRPYGSTRPRSAG